MVDFNFSLLKDYRDHANANADNWTLLSYLNLKYDLDSALAFYKFFFPDFIVTKNCTVASFLFSQKNFDLWFEKCEGHIPQVEKMCNLYEVKNFFHIAQDPLDSSLTESKQLVLAEMLKQSWLLALNSTYPDKTFIVETFVEYESYFISFYSEV